MQRHSPVHEWQLGINDFKGITTKKRGRLTSLCCLDDTCTAGSSAVHRASPLQWRCKTEPHKRRPSTREDSHRSHPQDHSCPRSSTCTSRCSQCRNSQEDRAHGTERADGMCRLLPPTHLRSLVAWLTPAVAVERITVCAVVALAFLFTASSVTAIGARVGTNEALENMGSKLLASGFMKLVSQPTCSLKKWVGEPDKVS